MSLVTVLIVDDEPLARQRIRSLLRPYDDVNVVGECGDAGTAARAIIDQRPDLVFLDVQLPGRSGFGVIAAIDPAELPVVIFVTAYDKYAVEAFKVHAVDYLLKPFEIERFHLAVKRARAEIGRERGGDLSRRLLMLLHDRDSKPKYLTRIKVRSGNSFLFLHTADIDYIESEANYVRIHVGKDSYLVRGTIGSLEERLDPNQLVRIHRSTIVNLDGIKEMHPWFQNGEYSLTMKDGKQLTISRSYKDQLMKIIGQFG